MKLKIIALFLLLPFIVSLHTMPAESSPTTPHKNISDEQLERSLVYISKHARETIIELEELLPDYNWSPTFRNLSLDIQDGGTIALYQDIDHVVNECLALCRGQETDQLNSY